MVAIRKESFAESLTGAAVTFAKALKKSNTPKLKLLHLLLDGHLEKLLIFG